MSERPILFSGPMVLAILDGGKTVTRRIVKPQPEHLQVHEWKGRVLRDAEARVWCWKQHHGTDNWQNVTQQLGPFCPYGQPGDVLWVRETWGAPECDDPGCPDGRRPQRGDRIVYRAKRGDDYQWSGVIPWRPSIYMPRWACRLRLNVTAVRVEQLQEISEVDAEREGVEPVMHHRGWNQDGAMARGLSHYEAFRELWDDINGKRAPWDSNPWVWVVEFDRLPAEAEGDER